MLRVVLFQCVAMMVVAAAAAALAGGVAAVSAILGGLACILPNGLLALHLALLSRLPAKDRGSAVGRALGILAGEFLKVLLTIALLVLVGTSYRNLVWPALIAAISAVLLIQPAAYAFRRP
jgi:ATP synthase protein I